MKKLIGNSFYLANAEIISKSAKLYRLEFAKNWNKSLIKMLSNNIPKIEPCSTPVRMNSEKCRRYLY